MYASFIQDECALQIKHGTQRFIILSHRALSMQVLWRSGLDGWDADDTAAVTNVLKVASTWWQALYPEADSIINKIRSSANTP